MMQVNIKRFSFSFDTNQFPGNIYIMETKNPEHIYNGLLKFYANTQKKTWKHIPWHSKILCKYAKQKSWKIDHGILNFYASTQTNPEQIYNGLLKFYANTQKNWTHIPWHSKILCKYAKHKSWKIDHGILKIYASTQKILNKYLMAF